MESFKSGICESCGKEAGLFQVPHHQAGNNKVWEYCEECKFAHEVEVEVNKRLRILAQTDLQKANDPMEVARIRGEVVRTLPRDGEIVA